MTDTPAHPWQPPLRDRRFDPLIRHTRTPVAAALQAAPAHDDD